MEIWFWFENLCLSNNESLFLSWTAPQGLIQINLQVNRGLRKVIEFFVGMSAGQM